MAEELNAPPDAVGKHELLYRVVDANDLVALPEGKVQIRPEAFRDRFNRPSVDRAHLRNFDPNLSIVAFGADRGIVAIYAQEVRAISPLDDYDTKGNPITGPQVDVEPKPEENNASHAEIFGTPVIEKDKLFKRLRVSLSRIAEGNYELVLWPDAR